MANSQHPYIASDGLPNATYVTQPQQTQTQQQVIYYQAPQQHQTQPAQHGYPASNRQVHTAPIVE